MHFEHITYKVVDRIAFITMNRSPVNSYIREMDNELIQAIHLLRADDEVIAGVLTSALDGIFSAGADINFLKSAGQLEKQDFCNNSHELLLLIERTPKPIIAAINGVCVGGGLEKALACHLRFMTDSTKAMVGLPEITLGVLAGTGGTQRLPRLVGQDVGLELMLSGELISPQRALEIGLVTRLLEADKFDEQLNAYLDMLRAQAPRAIGLISLAVQRGMRMDLDNALAFEQSLQNQLFATKDAEIGIRAYLDKNKKPEFTGQ